MLQSIFLRVFPVNALQHELVAETLVGSTLNRNSAAAANHVNSGRNDATNASLSTRAFEPLAAPASSSAI